MSTHNIEKVRRKILYYRVHGHFRPMHCKENHIYVFLFWELHGLSRESCTLAQLLKVFYILLLLIMCHYSIENEK
jgi:hypothetical protein